MESKLSYKNQQLMKVKLDKVLVILSAISSAVMASIKIVQGIKELLEESEENSSNN